MTDRMSANDYRAMLARKGGVSSAGPEFGARISAKDFNQLLASGAVSSKTLGVRAALQPAAAPSSGSMSASTAQQRLPVVQAQEPNDPQKRKAQPEFDEQCALFSWARDEILVMKYPALKLLSSSLNGVKLTRAQAGKAKAAGMLKGESDVRLPVPRGGYVGLIIEMKYGNNTATPEQLEYGRAMEDEGHRFEICYSAQEAQAVILSYLEQPRILPSRSNGL